MKKGFTIIEIIISIALIIIVGVIAIASFNLIKKVSKEKTLNNMNDEILTALRLYIETNDESKSRIYENQEGIAITLQNLESEGLLDFGDLSNDLTEKDYVVAFLSQESGCSDITTVKSWDLTNGPLYICSKSNGSQNLFSVGGDATNLSQATREIYYFKGKEPENYIKLKNKEELFRIISIERDDSLVLYIGTYSSSLFPSNTFAPVTSENHSREHDHWTDTTIGKTYTNSISFVCNSEKPIVTSVINKVNNNSGSSLITILDIVNTSICVNDTLTTFIITNGSFVSGNRLQVRRYHSDSSQAWSITKVHLKPCMQITGGGGTYANPYILENNCN